MSKTFEAYLEEVRYAGSVLHLFEMLKRTLEYFQIDSISFSLLNPQFDTDEQSGYHIISNFHRVWLEFYAMQKYSLCDPAILLGPGFAGPFCWQELWSLKLGKRQKECLNNAEQAGLYHGRCIPLWKAQGQAAALSLATSENGRGFNPPMDLISAIGQRFYVRRAELIGLRERNPFRLSLTKGDWEVVDCLREGLSNKYIAGRLAISVSAVEDRMKSLIRKIGVKNRGQIIPALKRLALIC